MPWNGSPTEGLLCGDAIITTTLPLSIYSSQSSPSLSRSLSLSLSLSLSVSLSDSPYWMPNALKGEGQQKNRKHTKPAVSGFRLREKHSTCPGSYTDCFSEVGKLHYIPPLWHATNQFPWRKTALYCICMVDIGGCHFRAVLLRATHDWNTARHFCGRSLQAPGSSSHQDSCLQPQVLLHPHFETVKRLLKTCH